MARARNIKPGFFKNEDLAECNAWARLLFAGLWTLADREGRLEDRPKRIKGELFAFDSIEVEPLLADLANRGFIHRYAVEGRGLIQIVAFHKHQNPHHREPESELPPPQSPGLEPDAKKAKPGAGGGSNGGEASGKPEASPGLDPPRDDLAMGVNRADSGNSDSGTLIPDPGGKTARKRAAPPPVHVGIEPLVAAGFDAVTAVDFIAHKQRVKAPLTPRAWADHLRESERAGMTPQQAAEKVMAKGWKGFDASYVGQRPAPRTNGHDAEPEWRREQRERNEAFLGPYAAKRTRTTQETVDMEAPDAAPRLVG